MNGVVYQFNLKPKTPGERGIPKFPVDHLYLSTLGEISHDKQGIDFNRLRAEKKKGTIDRAVLLLPLETILDLQHEEWNVEAGHLGENITTQGIFHYQLALGQRYQIGQVILELTEPCKPCANLAILPYIGEGRVANFVQTLIGRRGWYAKVIQDGRITVGNKITLL